MTCQQVSSILALVIFLVKFLLKVLQNRFFFALAPRSGFGAAISDAVACSSFVFFNSVSADRTVMAASRLLGAAAACVILLSFAAGPCKSNWSGCIKVAIVTCQQIFSVLLSEVLIKSASKSPFPCCGPRSGFGAAISRTSVRKSLCV